MNDVRVGVVEYFMIHVPALKSERSTSGTSSSCPNVAVEPKKHLLARVKWYQDHPQKFVLGNGLSFQPLSLNICPMPHLFLFPGLFHVVQCFIQHSNSVMEKIMYVLPFLQKDTREKFVQNFISLKNRWS